MSFCGRRPTPDRARLDPKIEGKEAHVNLGNGMRGISTLRAIAKEWRSSLRLCRSLSSRLRLMTDFALSHIIFALPRGMVNREHQITTASGVKISYRMNRGDLQSIREVWFDRVYRLPFAVPDSALLDLGANIGLTTLWMATQGKFNKIVAVEPDAGNAALVRKNLSQNGIDAIVIEAAVGPADGTAHFESVSWSNMGHVSDHGTPVRMVSVATILNECAIDFMSVVKVDIEGSEQALFLGPSEWLQKLYAMIVEFHPGSVDYPLLTRTVASKGLEYIPASPDNMDIFVRRETGSLAQKAVV
jgi:FkbM family methyltransferase